METLVSHCSQSIESKLCCTFLHQQWTQLNSFQRQALAKIIHQSSSMQQVHAAEVTLARRIIVVPMDREHRHSNVVVWIKIVNRRKCSVSKIY